MPKTRPNIVLIMVDQWRADCIGFLGNQQVETPNIDRIFSEGTAFTNAYSAVPSCIAARAALLTGRSQKNHGRVGYQDRVPWNYDNTLPQKLSEAGYHTHCVGKMHVFPARSLMGFNSVNLHDGYLHNERCRNTDYSLVDDYTPWLKENCGTDADLTTAGLGCNGYTVNPWPYAEQYHPTNWVTTQSVDFLRRRDTTKPFFLKVSYHRPHPPLDPPLHYLERYLQKDLPPVAKGDWIDPEISTNSRGLDSPVPKDPEQIDLARKAYMAQLTHIDCQINRLIQGLNEHGVLDNTLLLFISDHGDMFYDHNMIAKGKGYNSSAKVPFLVRFPDSWPKSEVNRVDNPVELRDVMPSLLAAAGISIPECVDGLNILPLCRGEDIQWREFIHGEHSSGEQSSHWITNGKETYIWFSQTGHEQYFDLEKDSNNERDLVHEHKERVVYLRQLLIHELQNREEGYVKENRLVTGRPVQSILQKATQK
jgi:arylsulfatase